MSVRKQVLYKVNDIERMLHQPGNFFLRIAKNGALCRGKGAGPGVVAGIKKGNMKKSYALTEYVF